MNISLDDLLEMEFEVGMFLHIPYFDEIDFYQFNFAVSLLITL